VVRQVIGIDRRGNRARLQAAGADVAAQRQLDVDQLC
jgi:hypothetical protein